MNRYKVIYPLGKREGFGSYETFFNDKFYTIKEVEKIKQYVVVDFVEDEEGIKYLRAYHRQYPNDVLVERMQVQNFPFGIDIADDRMAEQMANTLMKKYELEKDEDTIK